MGFLPFDRCAVTRNAFTLFCYREPARTDLKPGLCRASVSQPRFSSPSPATLRALCRTTPVKASAVHKKPKICTADELHYVNVPNSDWRLALWRYLPSPEGKPRNHPLLLLSGVGTNAVGYDLAPEYSFARFMSAQGFDTWILEVRGAGLSAKQTLNADFRISSPIGVSKDLILKSSEPQSLSKNIMRLSEMRSGFLHEGQNSAIAGQIMDLSQKLMNIIEESHRLVRLLFFDLQDRFSTTLEDFQKQLDLVVKYDWDFDHYLEEDVPAAMEYIKTQCKPKDGKLLAIGHSMGGILLYAMLSRCCFRGSDPGFASVATLGSSLDYRSSKSSLRFLLPLVDPAQAFKVPVIPIGTLIAAAHSLASRPPYVLSWLKTQISAPGMMHPELLEKLVLNNFCTVPAKLLLHLRTVFQEGGLRDRTGTFIYKRHLGQSNVPVLAVAGDQDLICPPEAAYETVKLIPEHLVTYRVLGEPGGPHYAHYDLVGGHTAIDRVYPCIVEFLDRHDMI
ncbi:uncharacterized protein LOC119980498 isoform X1 [Tripterygium wilfordii]|uniref:uncharacterized protein LOC119980498 isoform X1 n=1 Tax=Tripterygium wilfordii TaxID=458696 RepID=UPI0018F80B81|nr:uncharacterized protein LOC119980498 isoform X1 [Tripterygium wilfordii]